jgi:type I restriction enzyme S subunit
MTTVTPHAAFVWWHELERWINPAYMLSFPKLPKGWTTEKVRNLVDPVTERHLVEPDREYRMVGVKWYGEGVFYRETVRGDSISAKCLTPVVPGAFIYNRLFAWKVSFAVVPTDFQGYHVSNEFPQFVPKVNKISSEFLYLYFTTKKVINSVNAASVGSAAVSRNRFKEEEFFDFNVPLPPMSVQQAIVEHWRKARVEILAAYQRIEALEAKQEEDLLHRIGISLSPPVPRRGAFGMRWSIFERWDTFFYREDFLRLEADLETLSAEELGEVAHFVSRPWSKPNFPEGKFRYIEISSVSKAQGIVAFREVPINEAPSRATTLLKVGDLLISTTRPYLGAFAIVRPEHDNCVCTSGFAVVDSVDSDRLDKEFLLCFLKSPAGLRQMERRMTGGLYPAIVQGELEKIRIPLIQLKSQREFVKATQNIQNLITQERKRAEIGTESAKVEIEEMILGKRQVM